MGQGQQGIFHKKSQTIGTAMGDASERGTHNHKRPKKDAYGTYGCVGGTVTETNYSKRTKRGEFQRD